MEDRYKEIEKIAKESGWNLLEIQPMSSMISFRKNNIRINVYVNKRGYLTVGTYLQHPLKGKTQLFRKVYEKEQLIKIFENPRVHTGQGYYRRYEKF